jgi:heat shock protein HslJ
MKPRDAVLVMLCALVVGLPGCDDDDFDPALVTGVDWPLDSLQRPDFAVLRVEPGLYTLRLESDGALRARSDCNRCAGRYTLSGSSITVGPLACTRAFCGDTSLDQPYTAALQSARTVDGDAERLVVSGAEGTLRYVR